MKLLFLDTETTGLNFGHNEIVQMSGIVDIDGKRVDAFDIKFKPKYPERTSKEALEKQNVTVDTLLEYPSREQGFIKFMEILNKHCDRFDKNDKFYIVGYNVNFDRRFLNDLFEEFDNKFIGAYFWPESIDVMSLAVLFKLSGKLNSPNLKLTSVCDAFKLPFKEGTAHNSMYDIIQTYKLFYKIQDMVEFNQV